jgi:ribosomal protein S18 acetylase RimI-like enzyme
MSSTDPWRKFGRDYATCLARLRRPEYAILLAQRASANCGFLFLHPNGVAGSPYIASIVTTAEVRGQGVGSALLDAAERWIPDARHIFLCVSSFNADARRLYQRRGYSQVGEFPDYVVDGASEILMLKRLVRG